jgi:hypothetical protein
MSPRPMAGPSRRRCSSRGCAAPCATSRCRSCSRSRATATAATVGIVTGAALALLLILDVIAVVAIVATVRRLWQFQHPRRWHYLPMALALALLVGFFFVNDARVLFV